MTTLYQFYKGIQDQILANPELADYEVHFVDETTQKEVGVTPVGLNMFMGTDDEHKIFDFYCNIPQDTIDEYMENRTDKEKNYLLGDDKMKVLRTLGSDGTKVALEVCKKALEEYGE